jgi:hypothetical protein
LISRVSLASSSAFGPPAASWRNVSARFSAWLVVTANAEKPRPPSPAPNEDVERAARLMDRIAWMAEASREQISLNRIEEILFGEVYGLFSESAAALSGCQTNDTTSRTGVSSIPWNRPAKWEGGGVFGSQLSSKQGY